MQVYFKSVVIFLLLLLHTNSRPLTCRIENNTLRSFLCCNVAGHAEAQDPSNCTVVYPKTSIKSLSFWSLKSVQLANNILNNIDELSANQAKTNLQKRIVSIKNELHDLPHSDSPCFYVKNELVIPEEVTSTIDGGQVYKLYQQSPNFVQVLMKRKCVRRDLCKTFAHCEQNYIPVSMYTEHSIEDYLFKINVLTENGCRCFKENYKTTANLTDQENYSTNYFINLNANQSTPIITNFNIINHNDYESLSPKAETSTEYISEFSSFRDNDTTLTNLYTKNFDSTFKPKNVIFKREIDADLYYGDRVNNIKHQFMHNPYDSKITENEYKYNIVSLLNGVSIKINEVHENLINYISVKDSNDVKLDDEILETLNDASNVLSLFVDQYRLNQNNVDRTSTIETDYIFTTTARILIPMTTIKPTTISNGQSTKKNSSTALKSLLNDSLSAEQLTTPNEYSKIKSTNKFITVATQHKSSTAVFSLIPTFTDLITTLMIPPNINFTNEFTTSFNSETINSKSEPTNTVDLKPNNINSFSSHNTKQNFSTTPKITLFSVPTVVISTDNPFSTEKTQTNLLFSTSNEATFFGMKIENFTSFAEKAESNSKQTISHPYEKSTTVTKKPTNKAYDLTEITSTDKTSKSYESSFFDNSSSYINEINTYSSDINTDFSTNVKMIENTSMYYNLNNLDNDMKTNEIISTTKEHFDSTRTQEFSNVDRSAKVEFSNYTTNDLSHDQSTTFYNMQSSDASTGISDTLFTTIITKRYLEKNHTTNSMANLYTTNHPILDDKTTNTQESNKSVAMFNSLSNQVNIDNTFEKNHTTQKVNLLDKHSTIGTFSTILGLSESRNISSSIVFSTTSASNINSSDDTINYKTSNENMNTNLTKKFLQTMNYKANSTTPILENTKLDSTVPYATTDNFEQTKIQIEETISTTDYYLGLTKNLRTKSNDATVISTIEQNKNASTNTRSISDYIYDSTSIKSPTSELYVSESPAIYKESKLSTDNSVISSTICTNNKTVKVPFTHTTNSVMECPTVEVLNQCCPCCNDNLLDIITFTEKSKIFNESVYRPKREVDKSNEIDTLMNIIKLIEKDGENDYLYNSIELLMKDLIESKAIDLCKMYSSQGTNSYLLNQFMKHMYKAFAEFVLMNSNIISEVPQPTVRLPPTVRQFLEFTSPFTAAVTEVLFNKNFLGCNDFSNEKLYRVLATSEVISVLLKPSTIYFNSVLDDLINSLEKNYFKETIIWALHDSNVKIPPKSSVEILHYLVWYKNIIKSVNCSHEKSCTEKQIVSSTVNTTHASIQNFTKAITENEHYISFEKVLHVTPTDMYIHPPKNLNWYTTDRTSKTTMDNYAMHASTFSDSNKILSTSNSNSQPTVSKMDIKTHINEFSVSMLSDTIMLNTSTPFSILQNNSTKSSKGKELETYSSLSSDMETQESDLPLNSQHESSTTSTLVTYYFIHKSELPDPYKPLNIQIDRLKQIIF